MLFLKKIHPGWKLMNLSLDCSNKRNLERRKKERMKAIAGTPQADFWGNKIKEIKNVFPWNKHIWECFSWVRGWLCPQGFGCSMAQWDIALLILNLFLGMKGRNSRFLEFSYMFKQHRRYLGIKRISHNLTKFIAASKFIVSKCG